ncbi:carboxymuconolactone decarboxylase family protein [Epidermidibacterium keratini]|uniref:Carboxymuconolactone decarboxylase family protein n=1 Tax=Epidermidibacterium keratini TaxID=1891644 RepID=A0A7L4YKV9_9ACTN|nr:carboxymuconolactone decarboxylase family protein [Epidermidibacterium keratini]QHB99880.1 carboxymuconolactone decarboxylase family protein [Epidermidibacterium keratini]
MPDSPVLRPLPPDALDEEQLALYEAILGGRTAMTAHTALTDETGALRGPFDPVLRTPAVGEAIQQLGLALRHQTSLSPRVTETVVLTTAVHYGAEFEWYAHAAIVRSQQLFDEPELGRIRAGEPPADPELATAWRTAHAILAGTRLPVEISDAAVETWGERGLVEITALVGHYSHLALLMLALGIEPPE